MWKWRSVRGATVEDASGGGITDGVGLRADHRESGSVSVRQADRKLNYLGLVPLEKSSGNQAGPHHETRQLTVALPVSGSGTGDRP